MYLVDKTQVGMHIAARLCLHLCPIVPDPLSARTFTSVASSERITRYSPIRSHTHLKITIFVPQTLPEAPLGLPASILADMGVNMQRPVRTGSTNPRCTRPINAAACETELCVVGAWRRLDLPLMRARAEEHPA